MLTFFHQGDDICDDIFDHFHAVDDICDQIFFDIALPLYFIYTTINFLSSCHIRVSWIVCLNVKELVARSRRHIWRLSGSTKIQTHNHLVHKRTLKHLAKLAQTRQTSQSVRLRTKWLWVRISLLSLKVIVLLQNIESGTVNTNVCYVLLSEISSNDNKWR